MANGKGNQPTGPMRPFGLWAIHEDQRDFRLVAVNDLRTALNQYPYEPPLTEEEVKYCSGWLYLARKEIGNVSEDELDRLLVEKADKHLNDPEAVVLNG